MRPVLACCDEGEGSPPAADLEKAIVARQLELVADPTQLPLLRLRERLVRTLEDGAGVRHRVVEHQAEEVVPEVVVVADMTPGAK